LPQTSISCFAAAAAAAAAADAGAMLVIDFNWSFLCRAAAAAAAGMWHDGILSPANTTTSSSNTTAAAEAGQGYTLTQNPGVFASNFIPLWAGLTEGNAAQGEQVVQALKSSGLVGPAGVLWFVLLQTTL
jgi:hypothetical protein